MKSLLWSSVKEDALEVQDIRELGLGWAWFMNDLRAFLPAWQEMELASPSTEEPVTQIEADVPWPCRPMPPIWPWTFKSMNAA